MKHTMQELIGAALFDFAARLTAQEEPITLSARHHAGPAVDAVVQFLSDRGIDCNVAFPVNDWQNELKAE